MLDGALLDKLDQVARKVRKLHAAEPMAGIQVVLCGDFYQVCLTPETATSLKFGSLGRNTCAINIFEYPLPISLSLSRDWPGVDALSCRASAGAGPAFAFNPPLVDDARTRVVTFNPLAASPDSLSWLTPAYYDIMGDPTLSNDLSTTFVCIQLPPVKVGRNGCCFGFEARCWTSVVPRCKDTALL